MLPWAGQTCTSPFRLCGGGAWAFAKVANPNTAPVSSCRFMCLIALLFLGDGHSVRFLLVIGIHSLSATHGGLFRDSVSDLIFLEERIGARQVVRDVTLGVDCFDDALTRVRRDLACNRKSVVTAPNHRFGEINRIVDDDH